jgi:hypothetical protein
MVNLKSLSTTGSFGDLDIAFTLNKWCCSFQLESFRYLPENCHTNKEEYLNYIVVFLHPQSRIMTLHLHWFIETPFPSSCLQLEDLRGHTHLIEAALPDLLLVPRLTWFATGNNNNTSEFSREVIDRLLDLRALTIRNS